MQTTKTINLIGIGICDFKQITYEAAEQIQKSDIVFHLTLFDSQIKKLNLNTIDLTSKYISAQSPIVYQEFKNEIVDALATNNNVSVVNYGHPLYLVTTSQYIIDECNLHGYNVNFVPGVSSIDTIFCMLNKEACDPGYQVINAEAMVLNSISVNPNIDLYLPHVTEIQLPFSRKESVFNHSHGLHLLKDHLLKYYAGNQSAIFLASAPTRQLNDFVLNTTLQQMTEQKVIKQLFRGLTMFIPKTQTNA